MSEGHAGPKRLEALIGAQLRRRGDESSGTAPTAKTVRRPSRRERVDTGVVVKRYTQSITQGGLTIRWSNLTLREARQLVDLTRDHNHSTRSWWPLVLRGAGAKQRSG